MKSNYITNNIQALKIDAGEPATNESAKTELLNNYFADVRKLSNKLFKQ